MIDLNYLAGALLSCMLGAAAFAAVAALSGTTGRPVAEAMFHGGRGALKVYAAPRRRR